MTREWIRSETVLFFRWFFLPKKVIWKNHPSVATTTDCFEPIFGFLRSFWFEKYRSASWRRIGMFSELSGRSDIHHFRFFGHLHTHGHGFIICYTFCGFPAWQTQTKKWSKINLMSAKVQIKMRRNYVN